MLDMIRKFVLQILNMALTPRDPFEGIDTVDTTAEEDIAEYQVTFPVVKTEEELNAMTKAQLVEYAEGFGLEVLKMSWTKKRMVVEICANGLARGDS